MKAIQELLAITTQKLDATHEDCKKIITKMSNYKANLSMVNNISIDNYGIFTPIQQLASIKIIPGGIICIEPWDKKLLKKIEKAIEKAQNLNLKIQNTGEDIKVKLQPLTEESRGQLTKKIKTEVEGFKIRVRKERQEAKKQLEDLKNSGTSEDEIKRGKAELQKLIDKYTTKIDELEEQTIDKVTKL